MPTRCQLLIRLRQACLLCDGTQISQRACASALQHLDRRIDYGKVNPAAIRAVYGQNHDTSCFIAYGITHVFNTFERCFAGRIGSYPQDFLYVQNPEERQFDFMGEGDLPTSANSLNRRSVCADHPGINSVTIPRSFTTIDSGTVISSVSLLVGNFLPSACARDIQSAAPTAAHTSLSSGGPPRPLRH